MRTYIIILFVLLSFSGYGQEAAFVVIDVSGTVTYGSNQKALIGTTLKDKEIIVVGKGSNITLSCRNSGYARFASAGTFIVSTGTYCRAAPDAAFAKLCKFAWHQITDKEAHDDWRDHMDNVGAASRGAGCFAHVDNNIAEVYYYNGDFLLSCEPKNTGVALYLKVYTDANSAAFLELPLVNNQFPLAKLKSKLKEGVDYFWNVTPKDGFCGEGYNLHILSKHDRDSIVAQATKSVNNNISNKAERQYLLGVSLEQLHLFADALNSYKDAAKLNPADKRYSNEVVAFKKRYNMK